MATKRKNVIRGTQLSPAVSIGEEYAASVIRLMREMLKDVRAELSTAYTVDGFAADASPVSQVRIKINALMNKWMPQFTSLSRFATERMMTRIDKNSAVTLARSLKETSEEVTLKTGFYTGEMREMMAASTEEAASLIRRIPEQFLGEVQQQAMRSITNGEGLKDLQSYLTRKYEGDARHAKLVALDQTRKAYNNFNAARMKKLGFTKYEWIHSGGSQHPRENHKRMNGKIYSLDDPPVIGVMYGEEVRGKPGDLPNCRCQMRPIIDLTEEE